MLALAVEDFNIFIKNTLVEEYYITRGSDSLSVECLSTTSMHSISNEGFVDWVKDKLNKLGRRFVVLVNKVVARFSKNREKLEQNIELYKKDPNATVVLAVSPKTLKVISLVTAAVTAGIVAMVLCIPRKDGSTRIAQIYKGLKDRIAKAKDLVKRDKAAKGHPIKALEAAAASEEAVKESKKAEDTVKQAGSKVSGTNPGNNEDTAKGSINNAANATSKIADVVNDVAGLQDTAAQRPKDTKSDTNEPKLNTTTHVAPKQLTDASKPTNGTPSKSDAKIQWAIACVRKHLDDSKMQYSHDMDILELNREYVRKLDALVAEYERNPNSFTYKSFMWMQSEYNEKVKTIIDEIDKPDMNDLNDIVYKKMKKMRALLREIHDEMEPKDFLEKNNKRFIDLSNTYKRVVSETYTQCKADISRVIAAGGDDTKERILNIIADSYKLLHYYNDRFAAKVDAL